MSGLTPERPPGTAAFKPSRVTAFVSALCPDRVDSTNWTTAIRDTAIRSLPPKGRPALSSATMSTEYRERSTPYFELRTKNAAPGAQCEVRAEYPVPGPKSVDVPRVRLPVPGTLS